MRKSKFYPYLRPYAGRLAIAFVALLFTSGVVLGLGMALRYLVDQGFGQQNVAQFEAGIWALAGLVVILAAASYLRVYQVMYVSEQLTAQLRRDVFAKLLTLDSAFFQAHFSGDLVSRITSDAAVLQQVMVSSISTMVRNGILLVGGLVLMAATHALLTAMVLGLLTLTLLPIIALGRRVRLFSRQTQAELGALHVQAEEALVGVKTIQAASAQAWQKSLLDTAVERIVSAALGRVKYKSLLIASVILLVFGAILIVLHTGGMSVIRGEMSAGELSAFIFYSIVVASALGALSEIAADLQRASGGLARIFELFDMHSRVVDAPPGAAAPWPAGSLPLVFEGVEFTYPGKTVPALRGVDLAVAAGETVAIVGASGAGKTTLFQLLLRFFDPQHGRIMLGGHGLTQVPLAQLRAAIGWVPQDAMVFSMSIRHNVTLGLEVSEEALKAALASANAWEFIAPLPAGVDTHVGEKGVQLSGGQRQRLVIARMLLRNPAVLLLDEATSALDSDNELLVQQALEKLQAGRTTLVIAHRLSTVQHAHRIIMLHDGQIEAQGTHSELMASNARYKRYVELQFRQ